MTDLYHIYYYLDKHYIRQQSGDYDLLSLFLCHQLGEDPQNKRSCTIARCETAQNSCSIMV